MGGFGGSSSSGGGGQDIVQRTKSASNKRNTQNNNNNDGGNDNNNQPSSQTYVAPKPITPTENVSDERSEDELFDEAMRKKAEQDKIDFLKKRDGK